MYSKYERLRDKNKMRDSDISKATGIPQSTFTDWKNGRSAPKVDKLLKIADALNVSIEYFLKP